jgi:acetyl-CoA decarbonylase/synthase complex subunit gamma
VLIRSLSERLSRSSFQTSKTSKRRFLAWLIISEKAGGLGGTGGFWSNALNDGLFAVLSLLVALTTGAVLTPLLLPWLPGRAFSLKGFSLGLIAAIVLAFFRTGTEGLLQDRMEILAWFFLIPAFSAFLAMNFTGASTYTSLSGVKKEMKWALPMQISAGGIGLFLWLGSRFIT